MTLTLATGHVDNGISSYKAPWVAAQSLPATATPRFRLISFRKPPALQAPACVQA